MESCIRYINLHGELHCIIDTLPNANTSGPGMEPWGTPQITNIPIVTEAALFPQTGLQHQGIFRVSGSQVEVNDIKNSFERGEGGSTEGHVAVERCG